jgi:outer membrane protein insertion porin family
MQKVAMKKFVIPIILLCTAGLLLCAPPTVHKISIVGNKGTSPELVRMNCGLTENQQFTLSKLDEGVKNLYKTMNYEDVRIFATPGPYGYDIEIRVKEYPRLDEILFDGNKKLKSKELNELINLPEGGFASAGVIFDAIKKIEGKYTEEGMFGVTVKYELSSVDTMGFYKLKFVIDEGMQKRVKRILIVGNTAFTEKKIRGQMDTHQKGFLRGGKFKPDEYALDLGKIERFYHDKGYVTAQVTQDSMIEESDGILLKIWIEEGLKYYFKGYSIEGNHIFDSTRVVSHIAFKKGDVFTQKKMDKTLQDMYFDYGDEGYLFMNLDPKKEFDGDSIFVKFSLIEGNRAYVDKINIEGNTRTFEKVIRRELELFPGDVFRRNLLVTSQRNVYFLNYFEENIAFDYNVKEGGNVDLTMKVTEKPIGKFMVGAGYNATDKIVGNVSIGWPNVLGRGWTAELTYEFGALKNNFSLSFTEPWLFDTPTSFGFDIYNTESKWENHYTETRTGGALRLGRKLLHPRYWYLSGRYKLEFVSYKDVGSEYVASPEYDINTIEWPQLESSVMLGIERDSRDSRVFAAKGSKNTLSLEASGGPLGGQIEFQKLWAKSDLYFKLHKYLTFVTKGHLGVVASLFSNNEKVPYGEKFFPGGTSYDGQIRGYVDRSIGPIAWTSATYDSNAIPDASGRIPLLVPAIPYRPGGRAVLILTAELRVPIMRDQFYLAVFGDAGNTWLSPGEINLSDLKKSVGVGGRFVVPMVGILGLDVGWGFDKLTPSLEWHFQIGPEF